MPTQTRGGMEPMLLMRDETSGAGNEPARPEEQVTSQRTY